METSTNKKRLWTKYFIIACFMGLFVSVVQRLLDNTLAIFANDVWDSKSIGGMLTTTFTLGSIIASIFVGRFIDSVGRRITVFIGSGFFALSALLMVVATEPWMFYILRITQGAARAFASIAISAMAADILPKERMGEGMGYYGLGNTLASAFGPSLGLLMISTGDYNFMFLSCMGIYIFLIFLTIFMDYEKKGLYVATPTPLAEEETTEKKRTGLVWRYLERGAIPAATVELLGNCANAIILVYLTLYATETLGIADAGWFFTISAVGMVLSRLLTGRIVDRIGALPVLIPGVALSIINYVLLARFCTGNMPVFLVCGMLYGLTQGSVFPALAAIAVVDSPEDRRGTANSTMMFGRDIGILAASAVIGFVVENTGYQIAFLLSGIVYVIMIIAAILLLNNKARQRHREKLGVKL